MKKFVSGSTCAAGVALAWQNDVLWVAFSGGGGLGAAAPNYRLNAMPVQPQSPSDTWSHDRLLVLEDETTAEQPALALFGGHLWLAWTGTDPAHRLNLMPLTVGPDNRLTGGPKIASNWTAAGGPALVPHNGRLYLAFSGGGGLGGAAPNGSINVAFSADGSNWPASQLAVLSVHSLRSPSLAQVRGSGGQPDVLYLAFTGTNHLLYATNDFGRGLGSLVQILHTGDQNETSDFAPAISAMPSNDGSAGAYLWTGSGNNRHLYAMSGNGLPINGENNVGFGFRQEYADTSAFAPAVLGVQEGQFTGFYVGWAGTDAAHRLNLATLNTLQGI